MPQPSPYWATKLFGQARTTCTTRCSTNAAGCGSPRRCRHSTILRSANRARLTRRRRRSRQQREPSLQMYDPRPRAHAHQNVLRHTSLDVAETPTARSGRAAVVLGRLAHTKMFRPDRRRCGVPGGLAARRRYQRQTASATRWTEPDARPIPPRIAASTRRSTRRRRAGWLVWGRRSVSLARSCVCFPDRIPPRRTLTEKLRTAGGDRSESGRPRFSRAAAMSIATACCGRRCRAGISPASIAASARGR